MNFSAFWVNRRQHFLYHTYGSGSGNNWRFKRPLTPIPHVALPLASYPTASLTGHSQLAPQTNSFPQENKYINVHNDIIDKCPDMPSYIRKMPRNKRSQVKIRCSKEGKVQGVWPEILEWRYSFLDTSPTVYVATLTRRQDACCSGRVQGLDTSSLQLHLLLPTPLSPRPSSPVDSTEPSRSFASSGTADAGNSVLLSRRHSPEYQNCNNNSPAYTLTILITCTQKLTRCQLSLLVIRNKTRSSATAEIARDADDAIQGHFKVFRCCANRRGIHYFPLALNSNLTSI